MTGWKTKLAGAGVILTGIGVVIAGLLATPIDYSEVAKGVLTAFGGLAAIGLGHKLDKVRDVIQFFLTKK